MWGLIERGIAWFCLTGYGYQFWSGIGSIGLFFGPLAVWWRHHNCHVDGCWRVGHIDPANHHPACKVHHSYAHMIGGKP